MEKLQLLFKRMYSWRFRESIDVKEKEMGGRSTGVFYVNMPSAYIVELLDADEQALLREGGIIKRQYRIGFYYDPKRGIGASEENGLLLYAVNNDPSLTSMSVTASNLRRLGGISNTEWLIKYTMDDQRAWCRRFNTASAKFDRVFPISHITLRGLKLLRFPTVHKLALIKALGFERMTAQQYRKVYNRVRNTVYMRFIRKTFGSNVSTYIVGGRVRLGNVPEPQQSRIVKAAQPYLRALASYWARNPIIWIRRGSV